MPPPVLVNDYLNYLLAEGQLPQFEQSITKLPVECMDLNLVGGDWGLDILKFVQNKIFR